MGHILKDILKKQMLKIDIYLFFTTVYITNVSLHSVSDCMARTFSTFGSNSLKPLSHFEDISIYDITKHFSLHIIWNRVSFLCLFLLVSHSGS